MCLDTVENGASSVSFLVALILVDLLVYTEVGGVDFALAVPIITLQGRPLIGAKFKLLGSRNESLEALVVGSSIRIE